MHGQQHIKTIINSLLLLLVQKNISLHSFLPLLALNVKFVMKGANSGPLYLYYYIHPPALNTFFISYRMMLPKDTGIAYNIGAKYNTWNMVSVYQ